MFNRIEHLLVSLSHESESKPTGVEEEGTSKEFDDLMDAWNRECQKSTEYELLLDRVRPLLGRILSEDGITHGTKRRTKAMLSAIQEITRILRGEVG